MNICPILNLQRCKFISESDTSYSGIRLQQDQYNNKKFYLTDEKINDTELLVMVHLQKGVGFVFFNNRFK